MNSCIVKAPRYELETVNLNAFDLLYIAVFAERQHNVKVATCAASKKHDRNKSEYELHYIGAMGEYAVSKYFGVPMDTSVHVGGDNGIDLIINEWECHVKTFTFGGKNIEFYIDDMDAFTSDIGIFTQVVSPTRIRIRGCISRRMFETKCTTKDYGYGDRLMVLPHDLSTVDRLTELRLVS